MCVCGEGTDPVLFGPAGRSVFEGVTHRIAAVSETCRPFKTRHRLSSSLSHACTLMLPPTTSPRKEKKASV